METFSEKLLLSIFKDDNHLPKADETLFNNLYTHLSNIKCEKLVVETEYVDRDYLDDYSNYYSKCFKEYRRFCKRIHFFKNLDETKINNLINKRYDEAFVEELQTDYLGFIVIKPLPQTVIGRTILKPSIDNTTTDYFENEEKPILSCNRRYNANLFGVKLYIDSLAFQEQDTVTSACATSALWSALQKTTRFFHYYAPTPYEITNYATKYTQFTRPIPSPGLTIEQICQAIRETGLEPDVREYFDQENQTEVKIPILSYIYSYLRTGLPVILSVYIEGLDYHAITLVGYQISKIPSISNELGCIESDYASLKTRGSRISKLYAHDDQIGPFSEFKIETYDDGDSIFLSSPHWKNGTTPLRMKPTEIIIPLYNKIRVPMISLLQHIFKIVQLLEPLEIIPNIELGIEWDIYLTQVNEFKNEFLQNNSDILLNRENILLDRYPRFFWRCCAYNGDIKLFELLGDATDMERSCQIFKFIFHDQLFKNSLIYSLQEHDVVSNAEMLLSNPLKKVFYNELNI